MKFFTRNKVIGGVLGLIALVSVVNTQAILSLTNYVRGEDGNSMSFTGDNQKGQVFSSRSNCIRILPVSNNHTTFVDPASIDGFDGLSKHMFVIGFKIKNTCNQSISIIKDGFAFPNGMTVFQNSKLEDFPNIQNPTASSVYSFSGPNPSPISDIYGILPFGTTIQNSNTSGVTLTGDGEMKVTHIPANGEKEFTVYSYANANNQGTQHHTRLSLKKVRWFLTQSYNDNMLSANEVKVYTLTDAENEKYTTSYARFKGGQNNDCAKGTVIGYDSNGNPIFCGEQIGNGDCAEGTIIGYSSSGSPIFCGDESGGNDCAEGTVIGYDSNGNPIYCGQDGGDGCAEGTIIGYDANGNPIFCKGDNGGGDKDCAKGTIIGYNKDGTPIFCQ